MSSHEVVSMKGAAGAPAASRGSGWRHAVIAASDIVDRATCFLFVVLTLAFATVMAVGVFFRYALNDSLTFSDELALLLFVWAVCLSIASGYLHDRHVNVDYFARKLPAPWSGWAHTLAVGLAGGYLLCSIYGGILAFEFAARARMDSLQISMVIPYAAVPVAFGAMALHWARRNWAEATPGQAVVRVAIAAAFFAAAYLPLSQFVTFSGGVRTIVVLAVLFIPMLIGVPVAISLGLAATIYVGIAKGIPIETGAMQTFNGLNAIALTAIPLLILAGKIMHEAGMARVLVDFAQVLVGRMRGGLGVSNVVSSYLFGDISGSAVADTAAIGTLMIPQMKSRGYRADFCAALQGAAGSLGMLAPLAITVLLYASAMNTSVRSLATAMIAPALFVAGSFIVVVIIHARRHNYPVEAGVPRHEIVARTGRALPPLSVLVMLLWGILGGVFTPAEIGSVMFFYVLALATLHYRKLNGAGVYECLVQASYISGMTLFMVAASYFLGFMLARDLVGLQIADFVSGLSTNSYVIIFLIMGIFIVLGMFLEPPAMIFGFLPSFVPILNLAHVDMVHLGVLFAINMGMGCIVPPVALNLFISTRIAGVRYEQAVMAALPFILIMAVDIVVMAVYPPIPLMLPHLLFDHPLR